MMSTSTHRTSTRDDDSNRPGHARLPLDESSSLKPLHHVIHGRCRNQKVPLDVGFRWVPAESADVLRDEFEILALTGRRPNPDRTRSIAAFRSEVDGQFSADRLDDELGAILEMNIELCVAARFERRHALSGRHARNLLDVQGRLLSCDAKVEL